MVSNALGWDNTPDFPFIKEQGFGSILGLFCFYLYTGRKTYAAIWKQGVGHRGSGVGSRKEREGKREEGIDPIKNPDTQGSPPRHRSEGMGHPTPDTLPEALSDRMALLGLGAGLLGLIAFCMAAGVAWWVAAAFFAIYLPTIAVVTRIRAELGPPVHDFHFMGPDSMIPRAVSTTTLRQIHLH